MTRSGFCWREFSISGTFLVFNSTTKGSGCLVLRTGVCLQPKEMLAARPTRESKPMPAFISFLRVGSELLAESPEEPFLSRSAGESRRSDRDSLYHTARE